MDEIAVKCYGKINLSLNITGKRADGYHLLDMIMASVNIYDLISVKKSFSEGIICTGDMTSEGANSAFKAAESICSEFGISGVEISVRKNIPVSGGLGGSSADAVGVILALKKLFDLKDDEKLNAISRSVGSDISFMMRGGYARVGGIGDEVEFFDCPVPLNIVALKNRKGVNSKRCYERYDILEGDRFASDNGAIRSALMNNELEKISGELGNMLYLPAVSLQPDIERLVKILKSYKPLGVNMSGSGSTVYALMPDESSAKALESKLANRFCFCRALKTLDKGIEFIN